MDKEQTQINNKIRRLYAQHPELKESTKSLIIMLMEEYGLKLTPAQTAHFYAMPSVEVLYREARRVRNENGRAIAKTVSQKTQDHRFRFFKWFRGAV